MSNRDERWKQLPKSRYRYRKIGDIYVVSDSIADTQAKVIMKDEFENIVSAFHADNKRSNAIIFWSVPLAVGLLGDLFFGYPDVLSFAILGLTVALLGFMMSYSLIRDKGGDSLEMILSYGGSSFDLAEYGRVIDAFPGEAIEIDQAISDYWLHGSGAAKAFYQEKIDFVNQLDDARRSAIDDKWNRRTLEP